MWLENGIYEVEIQSSCNYDKNKVFTVFLWKCMVDEGWRIRLMEERSLKLERVGQWKEYFFKQF